MDDLYNWVSNKLNIGYIRQKVLVNDYNKENPTRRTWELYYVYNLMIIEFVKRVQNMYEVDKKCKSYHLELDANVGMILRLMFLKALATCNQMYLEHR